MVGEEFGILVLSKGFNFKKGCAQLCWVGFVVDLTSRSKMWWWWWVGTWVGRAGEGAGRGATALSCCNEDKFALIGLTRRGAQSCHDVLAHGGENKTPTQKRTERNVGVRIYPVICAPACQ